MISQLKAGDSLIAFFVLRKKELKTKKESDENYLSLELGDASGRISATVWDDVQAHFDAMELGDIVKVKGKVINYKDRLHLTVQNIRRAEEKDEVDLRELVPVVDKDRAELFSQLDELIASVKSPPLKQLLQMTFDDQNLRKKFGEAPGGKLWHHNYLGGLLEHSLSVTNICEKIGRLYPEANRDLLVAAGLLHDIGKVDSYKYRTLIDFTDTGRLIGHIVWGAQMVADKIKSLPEFPAQLETELLHLILSHQGKLEQASPVVPMTLEGLILYYADELDSKANAFQRIKKKEQKSGARWSSYVQLMNRYFYFGEDDEGR